MESHLGADVEGVGKAVVGHVERLSQRVDDFAAIVDRGQTLVDVASGGLRDTGRATHVALEAGGFVRGADDDFIGCGARGSCRGVGLAGRGGIAVTTTCCEKK